MSLRRVEAWLRTCDDRPGVWLTVYGALLAMQVSPCWYSTRDAVVYVSMARSMVRGAHLASLGSPQLFLPPGYPLLISPAFLTGDRPFLAISILHFGMAVILMLGVHRWVRARWPQAAVLITGLVMINTSLWTHYRRTLSELAFMTVMIWAVNVLDSVVAPGRRRWVWRTLLGSGLIVLLSLIRQVGALFAFGFTAVVVQHAWQRRLPWTTAILMAALVTLPAGAAVVGFMRYDRQMAQRSSATARTYIDFARDPTLTIPAQITEGVRLRVSEVGRLLVPGMFKAHAKRSNWLDPNLLVYISLFVVVVLGWLKIVRMQPDVFALTLPVYLGLYVAWPFGEGTRFMLPALPMLWACVWSVLEPLPWRLSALALLLVVHLGVAIGFWIPEIPHFRECDAQWPVAEQLAAAVHTASGPIIAWNVPDCLQSMLALSLDRPVVERVAETPIDPSVRWLVTPSEAGNPSGFVTHAHAGGYKLLRRGPEG